MVGIVDFENSSLLAEEDNLNMKNNKNTINLVA